MLHAPTPISETEHESLDCHPSRILKMLLNFDEERVIDAENESIIDTRMQICITKKKLKSLFTWSFPLGSLYEKKMIQASVLKKNGQSEKKVKT